MIYEVAIGPRAFEDLRDIYDWVAENAGFVIADAYVARIEAFCDRLREMPRRGTSRDDLANGLRTLAFERRATIAYRIEAQQVTILRVLHAGRDLAIALDE